ncbi:MAG: histidine--tRNA ligase [Clostridiales bacterium]|nr:histidine--tRNA ligase [Clostridiales bacterium]MBR6701194.1 histidine--tRNA ligase [Bacillota bacterium]
MLTQAPKGTSDILPAQSGKWQYLESLFRDICSRYAMKEIRTPMFEHTELFVRGVGDTTDVVEKQMYSFDDLAGRNITLKPEGTSPAVRAFVENGIYAETQPTKLYYITPCFRYEKMQKGRYRQFHQLGTEIFGSASPMADAEIVSIAADMFEALGMKEIELRINSVGCPECRAKHREALKAFLADKFDGLCDTCKGRYNKNPMRILDCKSKECQKLVEGAPMMLDYLCDDCKDHFEEFKSIITDMGIEYVVDPWIVRGLDYYTKTAFEFVSTKEMAQGTVCGGGRYDNLIEQVGGPSTPGVGFGMGIERLLLLLGEEGIALPEDEGVDYMIITMGDEARGYGAGLARKLRRAGKSVQMDMMGRNFKNQFKYANKIKAKNTIIIGEDEVKTGSFSVKNMATGEQTSVSADEIDKL